MFPAGVRKKNRRVRFCKTTAANARIRVCGSFFVFVFKGKGKTEKNGEKAGKREEGGRRKKDGQKGRRRAKGEKAGKREEGGKDGLSGRGKPAFPAEIERGALVYRERLRRNSVGVREVYFLNTTEKYCGLSKESALEISVIFKVPSRISCLAYRIFSPFA